MLLLSKRKKLVIINNSDKKQSAEVLTDNGKISTELEAFDTKTIDM